MLPIVAQYARASTLWALITLGSTPDNLQLAILLVESKLTAIDVQNNRCWGQKWSLNASKTPMTDRNPPHLN